MVVLYFLILQIFFPSILLLVDDIILEHGLENLGHGEGEHELVEGSLEHGEGILELGEGNPELGNWDPGHVEGEGRLAVMVEMRGEDIWR